MKSLKNQIQTYHKDDFFERYGIAVSNNRFFSYQDHSHTFYEFEYLLKGSGVCVIDGVEHAVKKQDLVFVTPLNVHSYQRVTEEIQTITVHFTQHLFQKGMGLPIKNGGIKQNLPQFEPLFLTAFQEFQSQDTYSFWGLTNSVERIVIELLRLKNCEPNLETHSFSTVEGYIHTHFKEPMNLTAVSAIFGYSPGYFSKIFKEKTGVGFCDYVTNVRLEHARSLLKSGNMSIVDVCYDCGFRSERNFTRVFLKKFGVSPSKMK